MSYCNQRISLIIPTLNAEKYIDKLMGIIFSQTVVLDEIIVIDSESDDKTVELCHKYDLIKVIEIKRKDFDHGGTRNQAIQSSSGDIILMLSQDVTPLHHDYVEKLIQPLCDDEKCAACSGRQIAYDNASTREKLVREFNYKDYNSVRDRSSLKDLGIKTFFMSDSCAAYKRRYMEKVGMYDAPCLASEDMLLAAKLINAGYRIAYCAEASVFHSHDYSLKSTYKRYFDTGVVMNIKKDVFKGINCESEGIKLAKYVLTKLLCHGHWVSAVYFCIEGFIRVKAHRNGKNWRRLSKEKILARTSNPEYFKKYIFN